MPDQTPLADMDEQRRQKLLIFAREVAHRAEWFVAHLHSAEAARLIRQAMPEATRLLFEWVPEVPRHTGGSVSLRAVTDRAGTVLAMDRLDEHTQERVTDLLNDACRFAGTGYFNDSGLGDWLCMDLDRANTAVTQTDYPLGARRYADDPDNPFNTWQVIGQVVQSPNGNSILRVGTVEPGVPGWIGGLAHLVLTPPERDRLTDDLLCHRLGLGGGLGGAS